MSNAGSRDFELVVLGRTLEHLGTQLYKRRDVAIAELVANAWDAGATRVEVSLPIGDYDPGNDIIEIIDNGQGMTPDEVATAYLSIGRNRRSDGQSGPEGRKIMGRKGVGKLAGFGLARTMTVETVKRNRCTTLSLHSEFLRAETGETGRIVIPGEVHGVPDEEPPGTKISLSQLKHTSPLPVQTLKEALSRRFSRTVLGEMDILLNGEPVGPPSISVDGDLIHYPRSEKVGDEWVVWEAAFSDRVLSKELQGLTIIVNGKTAQAPPFFFGVESTATGQHGTKYLTGTIEADWVDSGTDDESDKISTDRQEIDWDDDTLANFREWGASLVRRLLRERVEARGESAKRKISEEPALKERIGHLEPPLQRRVEKFVALLGEAGVEDGQLTPLADTIIRAFEYRHFHDYLDELETLADKAPLEFASAIERMKGWRVLEGRAVLEIIDGRIRIIDKLHSLLVEDAPETAPSVGAENLHDLIADFPWLINPDWQVFSEERSVTRTLREWGEADGVDTRERTDFLAFEDGATTLVIIEIKRAGHGVTFEELQRLERYAARLERAHQVYMVCIASDADSLSTRQRQTWSERTDGEILTWSSVYTRTRRYYEHYRSILAGDIDGPGFSDKGIEVSRARRVLEFGAYRSSEVRRNEGVGPQDF